VWSSCAVGRAAADRVRGGVDPSPPLPNTVQPATAPAAPRTRPADRSLPLPFMSSGTRAEASSTRPERRLNRDSDLAGGQPEEEARARVPVAGLDLACCAACEASRESEAEARSVPL